MNGRAQRVIISAVTSNQRPVTSCVAQGLTLGLVLFNIFFNDLNNGEVNPQQICVIQLGELVPPPRGTLTVWRNVLMITIEFNNGNCKREEQRQAPRHTGANPCQKDISSKGPGACPCEHQVEHEPAMCSCSSES